MIFTFLEFFGSRTIKDKYLSIGISIFGIIVVDLDYTINDYEKIFFYYFDIF